MDAHAMVSHTNTYGVTIYNVVPNSEKHIQRHATTEIHSIANITSKHSQI